MSIWFHFNLIPYRLFLFFEKGWNGFGIAEPILRVLAEKEFKDPTEIQALTFPAAIMGRRDILGAAETGSKILNDISVII